MADVLNAYRQGELRRYIAELKMMLASDDTMLNFGPIPHIVSDVCLVEVPATAALKQELATVVDQLEGIAEDARLGRPLDTAKWTQAIGVVSSVCRKTP
jgi:hypothetical protein